MDHPIGFDSTYGDDDDFDYEVESAFQDRLMTAQSLIDAFGMRRMGLPGWEHERFVRAARNNPHIYRQIFGFHRIVSDYVCNGIRSIVEWNLHTRPGPRTSITEYGQLPVDHDSEEPEPVTTETDHRLRRHSRFPYGNPRFAWVEDYTNAMLETEPTPPVAKARSKGKGKGGSKHS